MLECKTFKGGDSQLIFDLFESFEANSQDGVDKSQDYFSKIEASGVFSDGPGILDIEETEKTISVNKQYIFEKDTTYYIYIKKNKWVITSSLEITPASAFFEVLYSPPATS